MIHVFVDSCSFTFYRVTATLSWWKRFKGIDASIDDAELLSYLESQYTKSLAKISKIIDVPSSKMLLVRDCTRDTIWRRKHLSTYKQNRDSVAAAAPEDKAHPQAQTQYGPYIKHLNRVMKGLYRDVIRVPEAEADDIIGVLTRYHKHTDPDCQIIIIANDSDYHQLLKYPGVSIYTPKGERVQVDDPLASLHSKILKGDSSDNIPKHLDLHLKRLLIDFTCIPKTIQDRIMTAYNIISPFTSLMYTPMGVQLGLCCINTKLHAQKIFCSRTIRLDTVHKKGLSELQQRSLKNCRDLVTHLKWNSKHGYRVFRISSDLFPHMNNRKSPYSKEFTLEFAHDILLEAGQLARETGQRLTFHPGQYNVVGTPHEDKFQNTIGELDWHAEVLDIMGCGPDSVIVIHGGGTYGDKAATIARWVANFKRLPERVQRRLVLENCEKSFSVVDCLEISAATGVPVVLDTHHFECYQLLHKNSQLLDISTYIPAVLETWSLRHMKPKFHVSQQCDGKQVGAHSDLITELPSYLLEIPARYNTSIDIMIEAKLKEQAIEALYIRHPELVPGKACVSQSRIKLKAKLKAQPNSKIKLKAKLKT